MSPFFTISPRSAFNISKHISLVPTFHETKADSYFGVSEGIAPVLQWPSQVWPLLWQYKIHGKAQEVDNSLKYDSVQATILVPKAHRQKFRNRGKALNQTSVELTWEKGTLFDKWSTTCEPVDLRLLLEEFEKCLPYH